VLLGVLTLLLVALLLAPSRDERNVGSPTEAKPKVARVIGSRPSLDHGPGKLGAAHPSKRVVFRSPNHDARCRLSEFKSAREAVATIICGSTPPGRLGLWVVRNHRRPQFMGYPLRDADGQLATTISLSLHDAPDAVVVGRGDRARAGPRHVVAIARLSG
jgi:hypothetical protein